MMINNMHEFHEIKLNNTMAYTQYKHSKVLPWATGSKIIKEIK
jgi:hypothetical protein